jgi:hypothetical protein
MSYSNQHLPEIHFDFALEKLTDMKLLIRGIDRFETFHPRSVVYQIDMLLDLLSTGTNSSLNPAPTPPLIASDLQALSPSPQRLLHGVLDFLRSPTPETGSTQLTQDRAFFLPLDTLDLARPLTDPLSISPDNDASNTDPVFAVTQGSFEDYYQNQRCPDGNFALTPSHYQKVKRSNLSPGEERSTCPICQMEFETLMPEDLCGPSSANTPELTANSTTDGGAIHCERVSALNRPVIRLNCGTEGGGHLSCFQCAEEYFRYKQKCPVCQQQILSEEISLTQTSGTNYVVTITNPLITQQFSVKEQIRQRAKSYCQEVGKSLIRWQVEEEAQLTPASTTQTLSYRYTEITCGS